MLSVLVRSRPILPISGHCLLLIALAAGCAINPVSGNREVVFTSVEEEKRVGKEAAKQVAAMMGILPDSELTQYVSQLGSRLAQNSPRQDISYQFQVVDMKEPNAFALPAGYVYVSRGLLLLANSEDALAGAIGHEIGHVAARHAVQRQARAAPFAIFSGITSGLIGIVSPTLGRGVGKVAGVANDALLAPYGRDQEREADRVGQELAADSGWAPTGISDLLQSLGRENELHEDRGSIPTFLSTHPSSAERVANTLEHAAGLRQSELDPLSPNRAAFLARLDGLVVGETAAGGVFLDETYFMHPEMDFKLRFPDGWEVQNSQDFVGALSPEEDAAIVIELETQRGGPKEVAERTLAKENLDLEPLEVFTLAGLPAARAAGKAKGRWIEFTWVEVGEKLFRVTGVGPEKRWQSYGPVFTATADTFARLGSADRDRIRETRVRIHAARSGESVAQLVARVGGDGEPNFVAVVNGIEVDRPLDAGQLLKIPIEEPYGAPH